MPRQFLSAALAPIICSIVWLSAAAPSLAEPTITNISPRGLQIGATTTVVIDGADLLPAPQLILAAPIASQTVRPGATANHLELEVTLAAEAQPNISPAWIASGKAVSTVVALGIDRLPQRPYSADPLAAPAALSGSLGGNQTLRTTFTGKQGEVWVADVEAQRLGSAIKPVVRLFDARGTQIAWSPPRRSISGDARLQCTLPADGVYTVEMHEQLYRGVSPAHFRLKVGQLQYADLAFPLAVVAGSKTPIVLPGSNVAGSIVQTAVAASHTSQPVIFAGRAEQFSGAAPSLAVSDFAELSEAPVAAGQPPQLLSAAPVGVSGLLQGAGEEDKYLLPVTAGQRLQFEVFAQRAGSPVDAVLMVRNAQGAQLAVSDDRPGTSDPGLDFTVPAGVDQLQIALKDMEGAGGPEHVYRIAVKDLAQPDFELTLAADHLAIPLGGVAVLPINVARTGIGGPIDIAFAGLPPTVQVHGNRISAGASQGLVTLTAAEGSAFAGLVSVVGQAVDAPQPIVRTATIVAPVNLPLRPYAKQQLAVAVSEAPALKLTVAPQQNQLFQGSKLPFAASVQRAAGASGAVRLRLLTSQAMPKKTIKENNQDKQVDDPSRAIRLEGDPVIAADQRELAAAVLVPGDLPLQGWDLVVAADLLAADGKTVVASALAPALTLPAAAPFTVELTSATPLQGRAGAGPADRVSGKVTRLGAADQSVVVTLEGLPKEYAPPAVLLPPGKADFELPLTFPLTSKPAEFKDLRVVAQSAPVSLASARSAGAPVAVSIAAGERPAVEAPLAVFEDDAAFVAQLTQGGGQAAIEGGQKFSGTSSLKVTPDQKVNDKLPGLGVKIRENPGPGEYRYLQFAWKKQGGTAVCLQLNHDGAWGAVPAKPAGTFRYHAGPAAEVYGGSLKLAEALPAEFTLVTRDLYADFGEFTLNGLAFSPVDGEFALFDHLYLAQNPQQFDLAQPTP